MTQKLETTQAMRSLSHTRDPTDRNYSRGTAANAEKATAEAFKNSSYIFTYLPSRKGNRNPKLAKLVSNVKHESD